MLILIRAIYAIAWTLLVPVLSLLALTIVPKWRDGLKMKLGVLPDYFKPHSIWFHAVSVGELNALIPLLSYFKGLNIVLSTSTVTAQEMAKAKLKKEIQANEIQLIYMPWDHPLIIKQALDKIKPSAVFLMETEIWPSLIEQLYERKIPVALINARLADQSFNSYKAFSFIFNWIFSKISLVLSQSPNDNRKFLQMGVPKDKLYMLGNIKFAGFKSIDEDKAKRLKSLLGYGEKDRVIVAASTHPSEESYMLTIFQEIRNDFPDLKLVLAPRHPERFDTVEDIIQSAAKLETIRFSSLKDEISSIEQNGSAAREMKQEDVLLIDTIGDLTRILSVASIAFVGGTIVDDVGGHNVLEPAIYGTPVLIGENYYKNKDTVGMMKDADALFICESLQEVKFSIRKLLEDESLRLEMGINAKELVDKNKQVVLETANKLKTLLKV